MTDDLTFEELPPGRYKGTVEKIRYSFKAATHIVITYKLDTPDGEVRRIVERLTIDAPPSSAFYFETALGKRRVEDILRTKGLSLAATAERPATRLTAWGTAPRSSSRTSS